MDILLNRRNYGTDLVSFVVERPLSARSLASYTCILDPIGKPPIYPIVRGGVNRWSQEVLGKPVDYAVNCEEAIKVAHEYALGFARDLKNKEKSNGNGNCKIRDLSRKPKLM